MGGKAGHKPHGEEGGRMHVQMERSATEQTFVHKHYDHQARHAETQCCCCCRRLAPRHVKGCKTTDIVRQTLIDGKDSGSS